MIFHSTLHVYILTFTFLKSVSLAGLKYDVDLCIFRVPDSADASSSSSSSLAPTKLQLIHEHTFSALAYVAAGKRHKKFVAMAPSGLHCAIGEHSGYVFAYEHESLSGSSSSSSSSSSSAATKSNNARQQIVRLPEGERLLGLMLVDAGMMVLTESAAAFYRFEFVE